MMTVFTNHAASRAFEYGLDHEAITEALEAGHFKQAAVEIGRFVHYVKVNGRPIKVVTAPHHADAAQTAIVTVHPLDEDG